MFRLTAATKRNLIAWKTISGRIKAHFNNQVAQTDDGAPTEPSLWNEQNSK